MLFPVFLLVRPVGTMPFLLSTHLRYAGNRISVLLSMCSYVFCHAAPPTVVGGAHNSPIANATMLKSGLVHYRLGLHL